MIRNTIYVLVLAASCITRAFSAPLIDELAIVDAGAAQHGATGLLQGAGFGEKRQGPPVLFDLASHAYEHGVRNDHHGGFADMDPVLRPDQDPDTLYAKPSMPSRSADSVNTGMLVARSREQRHPRSTALYFAAGNNNFLGWPTAYGGTQPPRDSKQLYMAFWWRSPFSSTYHWAIPAGNQADQFITGGSEEHGEPLLIGDDFQGRVIGIDPVGDAGPWLHLEIDGKFNANGLRGEVVRGLQSGTEVVFPGSPSTNKWDMDGFISPRGKYARLWSSEDGDGVRISLGNPLNMVGDVRAHGQRSAIRPYQWNLIEYENDLASYQSILRVNGVLIHDSESPSGTGCSGETVGECFRQQVEEGVDDESLRAGLSLALLGWNDFMPRLHRIEIDDIYLDDSRQRVILADHPDLDQASHRELQRPISWSDDEIEFELNYGGFADDLPLYLFVFDQNGQSNAIGYPVCPDCQAPGTIFSDRFES